MSLAQRTQDLFDKIKAFPEAGRCEHGTHLKRDAYVAFLELRKLLERSEKAAKDDPFWEE